MIPTPDKFPLGIQTFEKIREGGYFYIDKTGYVGRLADEGAYYFLARPRRFGKSLFLSTAEAFFAGRRDLFAGLDADTPDRDWTPHEVIHIDLSAKEYNSDDSLRCYLEELMLAYESREDSFAPLMQLSVERRLANVIESLYRRSGRGVVILIDEYDKPLLDAHRNPARLEAFRSLLKAFYAQLKSLDKYIRFVLMSGVTRFGKTSIFSDLNNLCDISDDPEYAAVCGLTADEIRSSLAAPVSSLAARNGLADADLFARMEEWYGGYRFAPDAETVFNPFSILSLLKKRERFLVRHGHANTTRRHARSTRLRPRTPHFHPRYPLLAQHNLPHRRRPDSPLLSERLPHTRRLRPTPRHGDAPLPEPRGGARVA